MVSVVGLRGENIVGHKRVLPHRQRKPYCTPGAGDVLDRRDVLDVMHGRSRTTIDRSSHPYNAGTEHVGYSSTRQTLLTPSAKRREVSGESHEG